jgi:LmbE family N-acetylglucosaminyl deacetylase
MHLFLSPHPDDAVLSCGGVIYRLTQAGEPVTVVTLMAGALPADVPPSAFIEEHLVRWGLGPDPVPGRREEDRRALQELGAIVRFGRIPDALYRTDGQGNPLYPDLVALFGTVHPKDPAIGELDDTLARLDTAATLYAPLGAGHHVDHQLVRDAALRWSRAGVAVFFYEEYPYSAESAEVVEAARVSLGITTVPVVYPVGEAALVAKIRAITWYESQISTFWDDVTAMKKAVRQYMTRTGGGDCAERFWQVD